MSNNSLLTKIPNTNFLHPTKFTFVIPDLPFAQYFCQVVNLPGVSTNPVTVENPFSKTFRHGDKMQFDELSITVLMDEDLRVWEETFNWIVSYSFPHAFEEYKRRPSAQTGQIYYDGVLTFNTNSNNPNLQIRFKNLHPISISGIEMDTRNSKETVPVATIVFRYDTFKFERSS